MLISCYLIIFALPLYCIAYAKSKTWKLQVAYLVIKDKILLINFDHHDKVYEETSKIIVALLNDPRTIEALTNAGITPEEYAAFLKSFRKKN